ncbi:MAG: Beta-glucuronidase [Planctomycetes bacterium ADurb.Bin126]|nr:MAG: Beta-glucuronidase [Planctomycetes bacterium ADurb.Bin126]
MRTRESFRARFRRPFGADRFPPCLPGDRFARPRLPSVTPSGPVIAAVVCLLALASILPAEAGPGPVASDLLTTRVISLDGTWRLAPDPQNAGRDQKWYLAPRGEAKETKVPWIIQDAFGDYHGVAWYWREFTPPANPHAGGRCLLRFWAVDYAAEVWLNGVRVGQHEDGEEPFSFDVTDAVRADRPNLLAVRVLNPTNEPIDGITLNHTPHGIKVMPYQAGRNWNKGGICDSVELLLAPRARVEDVFVRGDWKSGQVRIQADLRNDAGKDAPAKLDFVIAPARSGSTVASARLERTLAPGVTRVETTLRVPGHRLWELNDPQLYRLSLRVAEDGSASCDERSVRFGFRDFRFERGCFRLNGRRIYLRCSHTTNCCPVGLEMPHDPDLLRRDLLNVKVMGFNAIRFIDGVAKRYQLDLCDEIGLMVYEESYAAWLMENSPQMPQRYDRSVSSMVRRDRNHACVTIWGLLNETHEGPVFRQAVGFLPRLRELDDSRMVLLNSGRWDAAGGGRLMRQQIPSVAFWAWMHQSEPWVGHNPTAETVRALGITWPGKTLALHPGPAGEYSVVRWKAPADGKCEVTAEFATIAERATTDVHVLHKGRSVFAGGINMGDGGPRARFAGAVDVRAGDTVDFAVGYGNGSYGADSTSLTLTIRGPGGKAYDAAADFDPARNGTGCWSYGQFDPGPTPRSDTFRPYTRDKVEAVGSLSNPGSREWQDVLDDRHPYQRVPHTAAIIQFLRTTGGGDKPLFLSEYGIGSAVDLVRVVRLYEQIGKGQTMDARFYRDRRDEFLADWKRWRMDEAFARPEEFFRQSLSRMAAQRLLGINAIRSNAGVVGHSVTGTVDQVMCGEGLTTTFRELKPGTVDALADAFAPLRWCLFVEGPNVYRGGKVHVEAVLANEDALAPGNYPAVFRVAGPAARVWERRVTVEIPPRSAKDEAPLATLVLAEDVPLDGPPGRYRFLGNFERGAAAGGGEAEFFVYDPPAQAGGQVTLWGQDAELAAWLTKVGIRTRVADQAQAGDPAGNEVIVACGKVPAPGGAEAMARLTQRVRQGATAIFLTPAVFSDGKDATALLPLERKGRLMNLPSWLYHKDEWAKDHPVFAALPAGGLMDYLVYRDIIPDTVFADLDAPAEAVAGANNAAVGYSSGLLVAVYRVGQGRIVLNTLRVRENLGANPVADRLLLNMIRYAQSPGPATRPAR